MAKFAYQAINSNGVTIKGSVEAVTPTAAANQLFENGYTPINIEVFQEERSIWQELHTRFGFKKPGNDELILFCRQCYTLTKSGVPIIRGFNLLADSYKNPFFVEIIREVVTDLEAGRQLSVALAKHNTVFSTLFVNIVRVGETAGRLEEAFYHLYEYYENDKKITNQIKTALRYPAMVLIALAVAIAIIVTVVVPKFVSFYSKNNLDLPLPTRMIMGLSDFITNYWLLLSAVLIFSVTAFVKFIKTDNGRLWFDEKKVKVWLVGDIVLRGTLGRLCSVLAMGLKSGVPILQIITVASQAIDNEYIAIHVLAMRDGIERGESLLRSAIKQKIFTPIVIQMMAVGEETGNLEEMLEEIAGFYEREVDYDITHINAIVGPILTVGIAVLVLLLMLAVYLPMWNVVQLIK